jgi:hypothetical protein
MPDRVTIETILKANNASDTEMGAYASTTAPDGSDLDYVDQLGEGEKEARATIAKFTTNKTLVEALIKAYLDAKKGAAQPPPAGQQPPPAGQQPPPAGQQPPALAPSGGKEVPVPPGKIDVTSYPNLKAESEGKIVAFRLPEAYVSKREKDESYLQAGDLQDWQWIYIFNKNALTKAFDLRRVLHSNGDPFANRPAFVWEKKSGFWDPPTKGDTIEDSLIAVTVDQNKLHRHMMVEGSLSGGVTFCPASATPGYLEASFKATSEKDQTWVEYAKKVHALCRWRRNKCVLVMNRCLGLAPAFEHVLEEALKKEKDEAIFDALEQIFEEFGHYVPRTVTLGGIMQFEATLVSFENSTIEQIRNNCNTAIGVKVGDGAKAGSSFCYDGSTFHQLDTSNFEQKYRTVTKGGDDAKNGDPAGWKNSVDNSQRWAVIALEGVTPITRIIANSRKDLADKLEIVVHRKQLADWGVNNQQAVPKDFVFPPFPAGHLVTLNNLGGFETDREHSYLVAEKSTAPDVGVLPDGADIQGMDPDGADIKGECFPIGSSQREQGIYFGSFQPAPPRSEKYAYGTSPEPHNLLWRLEYIGRCTGGSGHGEPIFWVVSRDQKWVLSAYYLKGYVAFASLYPYSDEVNRRNDSTPAQWLIRPALSIGKVTIPEPDPVWKEDEPFPPSAGYFRIYNPYYNGYLADEATINVQRKYKIVVTGFFPAGGAYPYHGTELVCYDSLDGSEQLHKVNGVWSQKTNLVQCRRTCLRSDAAPKAGKITRTDNAEIVDEPNLLKAYKHQCWYIEDRTGRERVKFDELAELDRWEEERLKKIPVTVLKPSRIGRGPLRAKLDEEQ